MVLSQTQKKGTSHHELNTAPAPSPKRRTSIKPAYSNTEDAGDSINHIRDLEKAPTVQDEPPRDMATNRTVSTTGAVHSVFGKYQKLFIVIMASLAGSFSAVSSSIYFPALNSLARDLNVSNTLINLTLTSYMVDFGVLCASLHYTDL